MPVIPNLLPELAWRLSRTATKAFPDRGARVIKIISAINWSKFKNVQRALKAFQSARQRVRAAGVDLQYTLIGPGLGSGGPAAQWAKARHVAEGVIFRGPVVYEEALRLIATSDVLSHPSLEEAMPGPIAEAMLMRVPVIAAREAGGARWLLGEGRYGRLFSGTSISDMVSTLEFFIARFPQEDSEMTAAAHARIRTLCETPLILAAYDSRYAIAKEKFRLIP